MAATFASTEPYTGTDSPPVDGAAVTPDDNNDLAHITRVLWIGTAGNVVVITQGGSTLTLKNAQSGAMIPGRFTRVKSTNTTASDIVAMW